MNTKTGWKKPTPNQMKASLHNHTEFSPVYACVHSKPRVWFREAFEQIAQPEGIVAATDLRNEYLFQNLSKLLPKEYNLVHYDERLAIIQDNYGRTLYFPRGIEFHTKGGHILGIGHKGVEKVYASPVENAKQIVEQGGIAIIAHPFAPQEIGGHDRETIDQLVEKQLGHALEGHNSQCRDLVFKDLRYVNQEAKKYAAQTGTPAIATCDSRHPKNIATAVFLPSKPVKAGSGEEFVDWLKDQIEQSKVPDKYFEMNIEGYADLVLVLRTLGMLNKLSQKWPWRKKTIGERCKNCALPEIDYELL